MIRKFKILTFHLFKAATSNTVVPNLFLIATPFKFLTIFATPFSHPPYLINKKKDLKKNFLG